MTKSRLLICICAFLCCCDFAVAQKSTNLRPKWIGNTPKSKNADFYFVEVHTDASLSIEAARVAVKQEIASNVERSDKVSVSEVFEDKSEQKYEGDDVMLQAGDRYQLKLNVEGTARPITSRRIDEYWTPIQLGGVSVLDYHALYAIERKGAAADFSGISVETSYASDPATWVLALIPGAAQFHKGQYFKGGLTFGGTASLAIGALFAENQRAEYGRRYRGTHDANTKRVYANRSSLFATGRNICIGAAAAVFVYNMVDAIVAPGARRVIVRPRAGSKTYGLCPGVSAEGTPVVMASVTF